MTRILRVSVLALYFSLLGESVYDLRHIVRTNETEIVVSEREAKVIREYKNVKERRIWEKEMRGETRNEEGNERICKVEGKMHTC